MATRNIKANCKFCNNVFMTSHWDIKNGFGIYCSRICGAKGRKNKHEITEGMGKSKEYRAWYSMIQRCTNIKNRQYKNYGGRGINICEDFLNSFAKFLEHVGKSPGKEYSIDRINNNLGYDYGNIRWATRKEQANNKRNNITLEIDGISRKFTEWLEIHELNSRTERMRVYLKIRKGIHPKNAFESKKTKYININGQSKTIKEWCKIYGIHPNTVKDRMFFKEWDAIKAITTPRLK
jgi:hypothetical protein